VYGFSVSDALLPDLPINYQMMKIRPSDRFVLVFSWNRFTFSNIYPIYQCINLNLWKHNQHKYFNCF